MGSGFAPGIHKTNYDIKEPIQSSALLRVKCDVLGRLRNSTEGFDPHTVLELPQENCEGLLDQQCSPPPGRISLTPTV